jgi:hypothetical protein
LLALIVCRPAVPYSRPSGASSHPPPYQAPPQQPYAPPRSSTSQPNGYTPYTAPSTKPSTAPPAGKVKKPRKSKSGRRDKVDTLTADDIAKQSPSIFTIFIEESSIKPTPLSPLGDFNLDDVPTKKTSSPPIAPVVQTKTISSRAATNGPKPIAAFDESGEESDEDQPVPTTTTPPQQQLPQKENSSKSKKPVVAIKPVQPAVKQPFANQEVRSAKSGGPQDGMNEYLYPKPKPEPAPPRPTKGAKELLMEKKMQEQRQKEEAEAEKRRKEEEEEQQRQAAAKKKREEEEAKRREEERQKEAEETARRQREKERREEQERREQEEKEREKERREKEEQERIKAEKVEKQSKKEEKSRSKKDEKKKEDRKRKAEDKDEEREHKKAKTSKDSSRSKIQPVQQPSRKAKTEEEDTRKKTSPVDKRKESPNAPKPSSASSRHISPSASNGSSHSTFEVQTLFARNLKHEADRIAGEGQFAQAFTKYLRTVVIFYEAALQAEQAGDHDKANSIWSTSGAFIIGLLHRYQKRAPFQRERLGLMYVCIMLASWKASAYKINQIANHVAVDNPPIISSIGMFEETRDRKKKAEALLQRAVSQGNSPGMVNVESPATGGTPMASPGVPPVSNNVTANAPSSNLLTVAGPSGGSMSDLQKDERYFRKVQPLLDSQSHFEMMMTSMIYAQQLLPPNMKPIPCLAQEGEGDFLTLMSRGVDIVLVLSYIDNWVKEFEISEVDESEMR